MKLNARIEVWLKAWLVRKGWNVSYLNMNAAEEETETTPLLKRRHKVSSIEQSCSSGGRYNEKSFVERELDHPDTTLGFVHYRSLS
jgi:hypothetical protein